MPIRDAVQRRVSDEAAFDVLADESIALVERSDLTFATKVDNGTPVVVIAFTAELKNPLGARVPVQAKTTLRAFLEAADEMRAAHTPEGR